MSVFKRLIELLRYEKQDISALYFYAILGGLIQLSLPLGIQSIISFVLGGSLSTSLVLLVIFVIAGVFSTGLLQVNRMKLIEKIQQQLFVRYAFQYAHTIPQLDTLKTNHYYLPELVNRFFDTVSLQKGISKLLLDIPAATIQICFGLILLSFYHPVFIVFGMALLLVLYLILRTSGSRGMETSREESDYKYRVAGYLQELARLPQVFKFSPTRSMPIRKTDRFVTGYLGARTAHFKILLVQYWTLIGFKVVITSAMLIIGCFLLLNQQLNIGQFIAAEIVILMVIDSVEKLVVNLDKVYDVLTAVEKINKVTDQPQEQGGQLALAAHDGIAIKAQQLSAGYEPGDPVLKEVSFHIKAGQMVCLQGGAGSGKSTLLRLLAGLVSSHTGTLLVNNIPSNNYSPLSLRSQTGTLFQHPAIFQGSLRENICMGDETIHYQQLDELAAVVGLKSFADEHPNGYERELQPMGQQLSAQTLRKIMLMRALIRRPPLLLLDEPWAGLEEDAVVRIRHYLSQQVTYTTIVAASNDARFAATCHQVIVLAEGRIQSIMENNYAADQTNR